MYEVNATDKMYLVKTLTPWLESVTFRTAHARYRRSNRLSHELASTVCSESSPHHSTHPHTHTSTLFMQRYSRPTVVVVSTTCPWACVSSRVPFVSLTQTHLFPVFVGPLTGHHSLTCLCPLCPSPPLSRTMTSPDRSVSPSSS